VQIFLRDYQQAFSRYFPRGMITFIVTHSRSLTLRQGRVFWIDTRTW
jgi:hypothetical protein